MTALVIAEHDNASIKGATLNTVTAAAACGADVHVLVGRLRDRRGSLHTGHGDRRGNGCGARVSRRVAGIRHLTAGAGARRRGKDSQCEAAAKKARRDQKGAAVEADFIHADAPAATAL